LQQKGGGWGGDGECLRLFHSLFVMSLTYWKLVHCDSFVCIIRYDLFMWL